MTRANRSTPRTLTIRLPESDDDHLAYRAAVDALIASMRPAGALRLAEAIVRCVSVSDAASTPIGSRSIWDAASLLACEDLGGSFRLAVSRASTSLEAAAAGDL